MPSMRSSNNGAEFLELRNLRYFVAVAEASGVRRAAVNLGVRQSVVSRRVRDLENDLGVSLFERHRAGVRLTNAGMRFLDDLRSVLARLDAAVRLVTAAGTAGEGRLGIGITASISTSSLNRLLRNFMAAHVNVDIDIVEGFSAENIGLIQSRSLDVAFVTGTPAVNGCDVEMLWHESVLAALPSDHPLASSKTLDLHDAADERYIVSRVAPGPEVHDCIIKQLGGLGRSLRVDAFDVGREGLLSMVGLGFGITLVSGAEAGVSYPGVSLVPLRGRTVPFSAVWSPDNDNPALRRFLSAARVLAEKSRANDELLQRPDRSP